MYYIPNIQKWEMKNRIMNTQEIFDNIKEDYMNKYINEEWAVNRLAANGMIYHEARKLVYKEWRDN